MKFVIDCTPEALKEIVSHVNQCACEYGSDADILKIVENARPLSELCEEEAKEWDDASQKYENIDPEDMNDWRNRCKHYAHILRSFGSKQ